MKIVSHWTKKCPVNFGSHVDLEFGLSARVIVYTIQFDIVCEWCADTSFPTPMEEPKKIVRCHYLGTTVVHRPTGQQLLLLLCRFTSPDTLDCAFLVYLKPRERVWLPQMSTSPLGDADSAPPNLLA